MSPTLTHRGLSAKQPHFRLNGRKRRGFVILPLILAISARSKHSEKDQTAIRNYDQQVIIAESKTHQRVDFCRFFPENVRQNEQTPAQLFADDISKTTDTQYRCLANTTVQSKSIPSQTSICHGARVPHGSHSPISFKLGFLVPHNLKINETDNTPSTKRELRTLSLSSHRVINLNHHLVYPTSTLSQQQEDCAIANDQQKLTSNTNNGSPSRLTDPHATMTKNQPSPASDPSEQASYDGPEVITSPDNTYEPVEDSENADETNTLDWELDNAVEEAFTPRQANQEDESTRQTNDEQTYDEFRKRLSSLQTLDNSTIDFIVRATREAYQVRPEDLDIANQRSANQPSKRTSESDTSDANVGDHNSKRCLLYTSPSPRDQRGSRMPSSA